MPDQISGKNPAGNPDGDPPPPPPSETTIEQRVVALESKSHTHAAQEDSAKEMKREFRMVEVVTIATNVILAIVGIFALRAYYGQLGVMQGQLDQMTKQFPEIQKSSQAAKDSAEVARDSLNTVQRANISLGQMSGTRNGVSPNPKTISLTAIFPWENAGYTPTRQMTTHVSRGFYKNGLPKNWNFPDLWAEKAPRVFTPVVVSPHGHVNYTISFGYEDIDKVISHKSRLFFWGWARYRDVFDETPVHITRFCVELTGFLGNPLSPNLNAPVSPSFDFCDIDNCQDEECKQ
jgi:hypothetical protein